MKAFELLLQAVTDKKIMRTVTFIAGPAHYAEQLGEMLCISVTGEMSGLIGDERLTTEIIKNIGESTWEEPSIVTFMYEQEEYKVFLQCIGNEKKRVMILGGGHISQSLVQILAILEYEVTVVDDRFEFAHPARFPEAHQVICDSFTKVLTNFAPDDNTAVIIVTRGHTYDLDCLRSVIGTKAGYIGMIGSRRKVQATLEILEDEGTSTTLLERVRAPIGLDLGGQSPAEIAMSIGAEVLATFKGGRYLPLSHRRKDKEHG